MNKLLSVLSLVALTTLGCKSSTPAKPPTVEAPAPKPVGRSVPEGWKEVKGVHASFLIPSNMEKREDHLYVMPGGLVVVDFSTVETNLSLDEFTSSSISNLPESIEIKTVKSFDNLNGNPAKLIVGVVSSDDKHVYVIMVNVVKNGTAYILACGGPTSFVKMTAPVCGKILASLEVK